MLIRLALVGLAIGAATQMVRLGAILAGPLAPSGWTEFDTFPWIEPKNLTPEGVVLLVTAIGVACLTVMAALRQFVTLFAPHAVYVPRLRIVSLGALLMAAAFFYGALVVPLEGSAAMLHLSMSRYPLNVATLFILAPLALVLLNFVREIIRAIHEYELRSRGRKLLSEMALERLDAILVQVAKIPELEQGVRGIRVSLEHLPDTSDEEVLVALVALQNAFERRGELHEQGLDGVFRQLRTIRAGLARIEPRREPTSFLPAPVARPTVMS